MLFSFASTNHRSSDSSWLMIILLFSVAFLMEAAGSYISITGLSQLFGKDYVILFIAGILDVAKITSVSFLYQYWGEIRRVMKYYMTAAVLVLMLITSGGAFGYLSASFQKAIQPNLVASLKSEAFSSQQDALITEKRELTDLKLSINKQIAAIPTENERARRQLISSMKPELERTNKRLEQVNKQLDEIRTKSLEAKGDTIEKDTHTGPIIYISKAFGISLEEASKYIILTIVGVFDPLAVVLILAANFLIMKKKAEPVAEEPDEGTPQTVPASEAIVPPVEESIQETIPVTVRDSIPDPILEPAPYSTVQTEPHRETIPETIPEQISIQEPIPEPAVDVVPAVAEISPQTEFIHEALPVRLNTQGIVLK